MQEEKYENNHGEIENFIAIEKEDKDITGETSILTSYKAIFNDDYSFVAGTYYECPAHENLESFKDYAPLPLKYKIAKYIGSRDFGESSANAEDYLLLSLRFRPDEDLENYFGEQQRIAHGNER